MLIYDLDYSALEKLLTEWNEPAYRAKQVWQGLYQHLYNAPEQFSNRKHDLFSRTRPRRLLQRKNCDWRTIALTRAYGTDSRRSQLTRWPVSQRADRSIQFARVD